MISHTLLIYTISYWDSPKSLHYYLYVLRPRRMLRPGFVITSSRFVELSVMRRLGVNCCNAGACGVCNGCCDCFVMCGGCGCCPKMKGYKVRSIFPHVITSARMSRNSRFGPLSLTGEKSLECSVACGRAGAFNIEFDLRSNTLHTIERRVAFCQVPTIPDPKKSQHSCLLPTKYLTPTAAPSYQALMCSTARGVIPVGEVSGHDLTDFEKTMYPLLVTRSCTNAHARIHPRTRTHARVRMYTHPTTRRTLHSRMRRWWHGTQHGCMTTAALVTAATATWYAYNLSAVPCTLWSLEQNHIAEQIIFLHVLNARTVLFQGLQMLLL